MVSYRFIVRTPCRVAVEPLDHEGVLVTVDLRESDGRREYQPPDLPANQEETYSTDELDLLSPGAGDKIEGFKKLIAGLAAFLVNLGLGIYIWIILGRGLKTDVFEPLPDIDVLDPTGGVFDVSAQQIVPGAGIVTDDNQPYPITGWLEAHWR